MTTLEKIRAEIEKHTDGNNHCDEYLDGYNNGMKDALEIIDRYADQEPTTRQSCDNCKQDRKECGNDDHYGFCQNWEYAEQEPCDDAISREAVVDDFIEWREKLEYAVGEDYSGVHLLNVAIQKIWDMPSVTPKPTECEDAVSRQAVKDLFCRICMENNICYRSKDTCEDLKLFDQLPSVRPQEPKAGKWVDIPFSHYFKCSECDKYQISATNYCPNCGAKMVEPRESEDKE